jgi:hypothetical protein
MNDFTLWLEFEEVRLSSSQNFGASQPETDDWNNKNDSCNIHVTLADGRRYGITVWTFDFFATIVGHNKASGENLGGLYQVPPDLFVQELTRECIEATITDLLKRGNLESVLNPSIIDSTLAEDEG